MRPLFRSLLVCATLCIQSLTASAGDPYLYSGDAHNGLLYRIDKTTGATAITIPVALGGVQVDSIKGLAVEPGSQMLYAVVREGTPPGKPEGGGAFVLATIAPDTGIATAIGPLAERFSGLAFVFIAPTDGGPSANTLLGVTGDGATNPEELFVINTIDASIVPFMPLGNGSDGEAIAYNAFDGQLYHLSGWGFGPKPPEGVIEIVFESINLQTMVITDIPLSGDLFTNGNGLVFDEASSQFLFSAGVDPPQSGEGFGGTELYSLTTTGLATSLGPTDAFYGGMGFSNLVPVELMSFSVE